MKDNNLDWLLEVDEDFFELETDFVDVDVDDKGADFIRVVDKEVYADKLEGYRERSLEENNIQKYIGMYEHYSSLTENKILAPFPSNILSELEQLKQKFSNGYQLLSDIESQVYLGEFVSDSKKFKLNSHILLEGPPGCGKTALANNLLKIISPDSYKLNLSMYTEAFQLSGLSMGYNSGGPGLIAQYMKNSKFANFSILVDEVDKGAMLSSSRASAYVPLYQLLEPSTARCFDDTALDIELDTSHISWIMTANDISLIPDALLSRCSVYHIALPSKQEVFDNVIPSIWGDILDEYNWHNKFNGSLSDDVKSLLTRDGSPREIKRMLLSASAYAAKRYVKSVKKSKIDVAVSDLNSTNLLNNKKNKVKMGFI